MSISSISPEIYQLARVAVDRPVFVVGTMRSGTGFLGLQLNKSNELVGCPFELRGIWTNVGNVQMASDHNAGDCPELDESYLPNVPVEVLKEAFAMEVMRNIGSKPWSNKLHVLNKNPHLCNKIKLVSKLFPQAKFLWTIRELDSVVTSLKNLFERDEMRAKQINHIWPYSSTENNTRCFHVAGVNDVKNTISADRLFPGGDIKYLAEYWLESNLYMLKFYQQHGKEKVLPVHQGDVLSSAVDVSRKIGDFLGLDDWKCMDIHGDADIAKVGCWNAPLSEEERGQLNLFREQHIVDIDAISTVS